MKRLSRMCVASACFGVIAHSALLGQARDPLSGIKRIYVQAFPVKAGFEKIREDLIAELRRLGSVSIVASEADADAIMTGNGETWIKGYRSLNPRSGRLPSNGEPVYAGFLSVELIDTKGDTLWSSLATAGPDADAISKNLSKQIVKHLSEALK
jgi:hypothetical protein